MFPPASIDPKLTHPLTPAEFYQRILVPQVGLLLIHEDLNLSMKKALRTMRESTAYGVAMFPVDGDGEADGAEWKGGKLREDKMGVADKIVLERARKRRKELEAEEREENEALKKQSGSAAEGGKRERMGETGKKKGKQKVSGKKTESEASEIESLERSKRGKRKTHSKPPSFVGSGEEERLTDGPQRPRPKSRHVSKAGSQAINSESDKVNSSQPARLKSRQVVEVNRPSREDKERERWPSSVESTDSPEGEDEYARPPPRLMSKPKKTHSSILEDLDMFMRVPSHSRKKTHTVGVDLSDGPTSSGDDGERKKTKATAMAKKRAADSIVHSDEVEVISGLETPIPNQPRRRGNKAPSDDDKTPQPKKSGRQAKDTFLVTNMGKCTNKSRPLEVVRDRKASK